MKQKNHRTNFRILFVLLCQVGLLGSTLMVNAQKKPYAGRVVDSAGEAIIGATVLNTSADKSAGTITNYNGQFSLVASANDVISVSYVGYISKKLKASQLEGAFIVLESDTKLIDEVVVVGYGSQKKTTLTGSVATLKSDEIVNVAASNVTQALSGRIAGITSRQYTGRPGGDVASFKIRGGGNALIVIDGVIDRDLNTLDPNQIETFTVLKDASATAVYGARGQNGVILVTTKRGKVSAPAVSYNGYYAMQTPTRVPDFLTPKEKYVKITDYYNDMYDVDLFEKSFYDYMETDPDGLTRPDRRSGATNFYKGLIRKFTPQQNHSLSINGGSDRLRYYFGGNIMQQDGIWVSDVTNNKRYNLRTNIDSYFLKDKSLKISVDLNMIVNDNAYTWGDENEINRGNGFWGVIYGSGISERRLLQFSNGKFFDQGGYDSPLATIDPQTGSRTFKRTNTASKIEAEYAPAFLDGFKMKFLYAYDYKSGHNKDWQNNQPQYNYFDQEVGRITNGDKHPQKTERADNNSYTNIEFHLMYNKKIKKHTIGALAVFSQNKTDGQWFTAQKSSFPSIFLQELNQGGAETDLNWGSRWEARRQGIVGRVNYNFDERFLVELNGRYDGSENFAPDRRWGFFPSASVGYRISEEDFFQRLIPIDLVNNLKIRVSAGQSGSDYLADRFSFLGTYYTGSSYTMGEDAKIITTAGESRIPSFPTWQTTTSYNAGLDLGMFGGKMNLAIDAFYARTVDILMPSDKSMSILGAAAPYENIGKSRRGGIDFEINYANKIGDFKYSVGLNTTYWNTVTEYINESEGTLMVPQWRKTYGTASNQHLTYSNGGFYQTLQDVRNNPRIESWQAISHGDLMYKDLNGDGKIDSYDAKYKGYGNDPQLSAGFNFNLSYKAFYVSGLLTLSSMYSTYMSGNARANAYIDDKELMFNFREHSDVWSPGNTDAKYPRFPITFGQSYSTNVDSDFWLQNSTALRMRNLEVGVDLSSKIKEINKLKLYISATNLFSLDNIDAFDPETALNHGQVYPMMSVFSVGCNLTF